MAHSLQLVEKSHITFLSQTKIAFLNCQLTSLISASYSTVLSLAHLILLHHPSLFPPTLTEFEIQENITNQLNQQIDPTLNKLYEFWCDYLSELILKNKIKHQNNVYYFFDNVTNNYIEKLSDQIFDIKLKESQQISYLKMTNQMEDSQNIKNNQDITINQKKKRKIAIINFATSQLRIDNLQPKIHLAGLMTGIFYSQGDQWSIYNILKFEYPSEQEYKSINTLIFSGSSLSVNNQIPEIQKFIQSLKNNLVLNPNLKILGICFGHQLLAKIFGGQIVEKNLLTGIEKIEFNQKYMNQVPYFKRSNLDQNFFQLSEYHKDFVTQIPQNFNVLAQSSTCKNESLISKNMKYLSFQFHPEYSAQYIKKFENRLQYYQIYNQKSLYSHHQIGSIRHQSSLWQIRKVIRNFIDWNPQQQYNSQH